MELMQLSFGPYVQSERLELYKKHANVLVEQGHAYPSYNKELSLNINFLLRKI